MAYRKQKQRILAGSMNLWPPVDLTPEPDSLDLTNWRVDQAGALRSRKGHTVDGSGLPGPVHSLFRVGDDRYIGAGATLKKGAGGEFHLADGFDGAPLGMAAYQGFTWVMNRQKQGKAEGANYREWLPAPPGHAPTATAVAEQTVTIAEFESNEGWELKRWSGGVRVLEPDAEIVLTNQGTVTATNGSTTLTGSGTDWSDAYAGKNIRIDTTTPGVYVYTVVASVQSATQLTLITPYDFPSASGLAYQITETQTAKTFDSSNKVSGSQSIAINANPAARWQLEREFSPAVDLSIDGQQRGEDKFRMWFYAEDPRAITGIRVTLFSGSGAVRQAVAVDVPVSVLNPAEFTWTRLEVSRKLDPYALLHDAADYQNLLRRMSEAQSLGNQVEYDLLNQQRLTLFEEVLARTPHFRSVTAPVGGADEFDWTAVTGMWVEVEVSTPVFFHLDRAEMAGSVEGSYQGEFTWWVTFDTPEGHESNPSPDGDAVVLKNQQVKLDNIPVSPDPQVTMRHIYGVGGTLNVPLRFATIPDNVTTEYTVNVPIDTVQRRNTRLRFDHDPPPPARGMIGPYFGRLLAFSSAAHPERYWWTDPARPWHWPGSDDENEGNWNDCGAEREAIVQATHHKRMVVFYKERSIWRLQGDPDRNDPEQTNAEVGLVSARGVCSVGAVDYFRGPEGIYRFNGDFAERVSHKIDPIFKGDAVRLADDIVIAPESVEHRSQSVLEHINGRLYFSYVEQGRTTPNVTLVMDLETGRWYRDSRGFTALYDEGTSRGLIAGTADGQVLALEHRNDDAGAAIPVVWHSGYYDQGLPDNDKRYADLVIDYETPDPITVKMAYGNKTVEAIGSIQSTTRTTRIFPLSVEADGRKARNAAIRLEGNLTREAIIYGVYLHWYAEERQARSFDSGVIDLGSPHGKRLVEMLIPITAAGQVSWAWSTDIPGGTVSQRATGSFPATAGRRNVSVMLPDQVYGRLVRLRMWSPLDFQLHAPVRVRVLVLPELIDGAAGDAWESVPIG